jgi:hypothetical protein
MAYDLFKCLFCSFSKSDAAFPACRATPESPPCRCRQPKAASRKSAPPAHRCAPCRRRIARAHSRMWIVEVEIVAQRIKERHIRIGIHRVNAAVHVKDYSGHGCVLPIEGAPEAADRCMPSRVSKPGYRRNREIFFRGLRGQMRLGPTKIMLADRKRSDVLASDLEHSLGDGRRNLRDRFLPHAGDPFIVGL